MSSDYPAWRARLAEGIDRRFYTLEYVDWLVMSGRARLWTNGRSAVVTEIKTFPTGARAVAVVIAAGDDQELVDALRPEFEAWGRDNGCAYSLVESRPGWARKLKPHGYEPFQTSIVKEL